MLIIEARRLTQIKALSAAIQTTKEQLEANPGHLGALALQRLKRERRARQADLPALRIVE